ncbi:MAG: flagellar hook-basal body complex protein [Planctomycetota bacterium]|jgi:flagellar hook-basal body protein|nr:flagellar hook-basal body complex protein [Planctomycetota bacterium]
MLKDSFAASKSTRSGGMAAKNPAQEKTMALSQALSTGITGLMTHQKAMDNIGNNLANVNTVGFKKGVYQFTTLLEQTLRGGMTADAQTGRGSINPLSLGLGAQTGSINKVFTQGPIENTGNPNDMAIDGNGFFVLRQGNGYVYTRAGSFYRGEDGSLMASSGLFVQGTMAVKDASGGVYIPQDARLQNIVIPIGETGGHSQTSTVSFMGNLDSRQEVATGTRLFGGTSYPTVSSLQKWMEKDFNGGDPITTPSVDTTWTALEEKSYVISQGTLNAFQADLGATSLPSAIGVHDSNTVMDTLSGSSVYDYLVIPLSGTPYVEHSATPLAVDAIIANNGIAGNPKWIPLVEEVKTINGGNVQTSAAYGVKVPDFLPMGNYVGDDGITYAVNNNHTYPQWFYESTGGNFQAAAGYSEDDYTGGPAATTTIDALLRSVWPNGFNGDPWGTGTLTLANMPYAGEMYPASLSTPLGYLQYYKGNVWVQPFSNVKNGDTISLSFKKGESQISADFIYNRPVGPDPFNGQQALDREKSFTLEHLLTFMAGDVDEPTVACQRITPAMFGAPVTSDYPEGDYNSTSWNRAGYETALANVRLAESNANLDSVGGVMGLLSLPPRISDLNYGTANYDAPAESAGAFTRTGVQKDVYYERWNPLPIPGQMEKVQGNSFNASIVSNLGLQNAISDIQLSYNSVPHESMFKAETEYQAPQGGSALVSVDFYDSLGNPKTAMVRLTMVSQDTNFTTWRWYADSTDDTDFPWQANSVSGDIVSNLNVGTGLFRFDKDGNFVNGSDYSETGGITINQVHQGVNDPIVISIINGLASGNQQNLDFSELTGSAISNSLRLESQNGRPPGTLDDFTVGLDGVIQGIYSNGNVVPLARVGLALIPNMNGLIAAGNNLFYVGPASGDPLYGHANLGGTGTIRHMQLESSNVDLSEEFTKLISTERGFQANSRTITTADEMITELLNLKR